jgi:hypothetical protein
MMDCFVTFKHFLLKEVVKLNVFTIFVFVMLMSGVNGGVFL